MEEKDSMLTTFDNPFNPFTDFVRWWKEDLLLGHDCCGLLARESNTSDVASDEVNDKAIIAAMSRSGMYTQKEIADRLGISASTVSSVLRNE